MIRATMKLYVVAGTPQQYEDCLRAMRTAAAAAVYVAGPETLRGVELQPGQVVYFGTYMQRPDLPAIVRAIGERMRLPSAPRAA